jgi:hypothetical protein
MKEFKTPEYVTYYQGGKWHRVKQADFKPAVEIKTETINDKIILDYIFKPAVEIKTETINDKIILDYIFKKGVTHASNT